MKYKTGRGTPKPDQPTFLFPPDLVGKRSSSLENARPVPTTTAFKGRQRESVISLA